MSISGHTLTLTWQDFLGSAPAHARSDAFTSTSYDVQTNYTMRTSQGRQSDFRLSTVSILVRLDRARMWARPSARTPDLLRHEQGHYDITALLMRDLHTDLTALLQSARTFPTKQALEQAIADLQQPTVDLDDRLQSTATAEGTYDKQTDHGRNATVQGRWNTALAGARSNSATRLADCLRNQGIVVR
jgi:predicted secreted Zn-dependent protease